MRETYTKLNESTLRLQKYWMTSNWPSIGLYMYYVHSLKARFRTWARSWSEHSSVVYHLYKLCMSFRAFPELSSNFFVWKSICQGGMCKFLRMNITRSIIGGREFPYKHCESNFCSLIPQEKNNRVNTSYLKNNLLFFLLILIWFFSDLN